MSIRDLGLAIVRRAPWTEFVGRRLYSRLPAALHDTPTSRAHAFFAGEPYVAFMQIGAHDGLAGDPVRPLVMDHPGWSGLLIEPQLDAFAKLRRNYASESGRLRLLNAAISDRSGERAFYFLAREEMERLDLPDWGGEIASFDADHLRGHFPFAQLAEWRVQTMSFGDAAKLLPDERVDLVIMDVEGHEAVILPTIDFDRHRVRFVIYEHKHMPPQEQQCIGDLLRRHGFDLKAFGRDTIAWRSSPQLSSAA